MPLITLLIFAPVAAAHPACCDDTCAKLALVAEAEGLVPDALAHAEKFCCTGCAPGTAVQLPGRCLETYAGDFEEHRVVDVWDCDVQWAWQQWRWGADGTSLVNVHTNKCLSVYSYAPPRVDQSSKCTTRWAFTPASQLVDVASGLCLIVDGRVVGRDRDANFSVWPGSGDSDWNTYAGNGGNGGHITLAPCTHPSAAAPSAAPPPSVPAREQWQPIYGSTGGAFALRTGLSGSAALVGGVPSTCGDFRSTQTCAAPPDGQQWPRWVLANRAAAASERQASHGDDMPGPPQGSDPYKELPWLQSNIVATQMMVHDRKFYDAAHGNYTVDTYLDDLIQRFGGIDSVLMWYPYPNLGVDERTQLEFLASMPGGLAGVREAVKRFHARGVRVLIPLLPWDANARGIGPPDLAKAIAAIDADGFNGDTMTGIPYEYFGNVSAQLGRPAVLQPEDGNAGSSGLRWTATSWAYGFQSGPVPQVSWYRQIEPAHMPLVCNRWATDHTRDILSAYFNAVGFVAWEDVWGLWNEITERDSELLRRAATLLRHFGPTLLRTPLFEPFYTAFALNATKPPPATFAVSKFANATEQRALYLIVSTADIGANTTMELELPRASTGTFEYYDAYRGKPLAVTRSVPCGGDSGLAGSEATESGGASSRMVEEEAAAWRWGVPKVSAPSSSGAGLGAAAPSPPAASPTIRFTCDYVSLSIEGQGIGAYAGIGAVLAARPQSLSQTDRALLKIMAEHTKTPLSNYSSRWRGPLPQALVPSPNATLDEGTAGAQGMVKVQLTGAQAFTFEVVGSEIEDGCCPFNPYNAYYDTLGVDVMYPWEKSPGREHSRTFSTADLPPFYIDEHLVTNQKFEHFMRSAAYQPRDELNFLRHWVKHHLTKRPAQGTEQQPVRWVSLEDAREYCAWRGARLPQEVEWQLAAQGADQESRRPGRLYPWGDDAPDGSGKRVPKPRTDLSQPFAPDDVGSHPEGESPYGVHDMVGSLWQWTSEFLDERTRAATLRGGSAYQPASTDQFGDNWYFPGGAPYTVDASRTPTFVPFGNGVPWGSGKYPRNYQLSSHAKLLLMAPSLDRSGGIGFRCAADVNHTAAAL